MKVYGHSFQYTCTARQNRESPRLQISFAELQKKSALVPMRLQPKFFVVVVVVLVVIIVVVNVDVAVTAVVVVVVIVVVNISAPRPQMKKSKVTLISQTSNSNFGGV